MSRTMSLKKYCLVPHCLARRYASCSAPEVGAPWALAQPPYSEEKTSVWWDFDSCKPPSGYDLRATISKIELGLLRMNYRGPVCFHAYGDNSLVPVKVRRCLKMSRVLSYPGGQTVKDMLLDMMEWVVNNSAPANVLVITGDTVVLSDTLHKLRERNYNILLAQLNEASTTLTWSAKNVWLWTDLASGGLPKLK